MADVLATIRSARRQMDDDPSLSVYMIRDLQETKDAGLADVAYELAKSYCPRQDAEWLLDALEKHVQGASPDKAGILELTPLGRSEPGSEMALASASPARGEP